jgi:glycosyltransferase involved in cell wall biosynthesis
MDKMKTILHISEVDFSLNGGMARVEHHWKQAFQQAGYNFVHLGPSEIGDIAHKSLFGWKAYCCFKRQRIKPVAIIAHEPAALYFLDKDIPTFVESHGVERRYWECENNQESGKTRPLKTRMLYPVWRLGPCDIALQKAHKLLLINDEDKRFVQSRYHRQQKDIYVFKNGVDQMNMSSQPQAFTVLFNGSWIERKGYPVLVKAAGLLAGRGVQVNYLLIGTGKSEQEVLEDWPAQLKKYVRVVPSFSGEQEEAYLNETSIVVLPSSFEGQPLSILQAMAAGKCCITTDCCGQKDFIEDGKTGFLFDPGDSAALAMLIEWCKADPEITSQIGRAARASVQGRSWERVSTEVVRFVTQHI